MVAPDDLRRSELKKLAKVRMADGRSLLDARRYAACYYLLGYAVEAALKACVAKQFRANAIPDKNRVNSIYTHVLEKLVRVAELEQALVREREADRDFEVNWLVVKDWKTDRRYQTQATRQEASNLYDAIADPTHGVFQWLRRHW